MTVERFKHYVLGHAALDADHWTLFQKLYLITTAMKNSRFDVAAVQLIDLRKFVVCHNVLERDMMEECNFPFAKYHTQHNFSILDAIDKINSHIGRSACTIYEINAFEETFLDHIDHSDRQLVEYYLKERNPV